MADQHQSLIETIYQTIVARQAPTDATPATNSPPHPSSPTDIDFLLLTTLQTHPSPTPTLSPSLLSALNSTSSRNASMTSSHIYHPVQVGTVLNPTDVPAKWAPKDLDVEKKQREWFLWGVLYFWAGVLLVIWAMGWYEGLWYTDLIWGPIKRRRLRKVIRATLERDWEQEGGRERTEKEKKAIVEKMLNLPKFLEAGA